MPEGPITIYKDNTSAKKWAKDLTLNKNKRHLRIAYHYVRQEVAEGNIRVEYVASAKNPIDGFIKGLVHKDYKRFVSLLGMA